MLVLAPLALLSSLGILALGGRYSPTLDLLNHFEVFILAAAIILVALALSARPVAWPFAALGMVAALACLAQLGPEWMAGWLEPRPTPSAARTITILTQNLWERNPNPAKTAEEILRANADVVVLQEALGPSHDIVPLLAADYPYRADTTPYGAWCAMAILSKRPIRTWSYHYGDWRPPNFDRLGYVRATIDGGVIGPFEVIGTQLIHPYASHGAAAAQAAQLLDEVQSADRRSAILAGDFNRVPWSFSLKRFDAQAPLKRRTHGLATWPNRLPFWNGAITWPLPFLPIDQVYAGTNWKVAAVRRAPATASDHYGVLATLVYQP